MKNILEHILSELKVKHTELYAKKIYNEHPSKDNLFGISKLLSDYGIKGAITDIIDKNIELLEFPAVVNLGGNNVLIHQISDDNAIATWNNGKIKISLDDFLQLWNGKAIFPKAGKESAEPSYKENLKNHLYNIVRKYLLYIIAGILLVAGFTVNKTLTQPILSIQLIINIIGVYIGYLLVQKQMHIHNDRADKICSIFSKSGCSGVLESSAAKLFGIIGWSEVGLSYFISNILIVTIFPNFFPYMALVNICTLPYSFWSVWYQKFRAGQWCTLCLIVQALLWVVFVANLIFTSISVPTFYIVDLAITATIYLIPFLVISFLLPVLNHSQDIQTLTGVLNKLKAKREVFITLLTEQPYYEVNDSVSHIIWENKNTGIQITVITNPYCGYCADMHQRIEKSLKKIGDKISVRYVFSFDLDTERGCRFLVAVFLDENVTPEEKKDIFNKWFQDSKNRNDNFIKRHDIDIDGEAVIQEIENHKQWCTQTNNHITPTILIDGHKLPPNYTIEDIVRIIE